MTTQPDQSDPNSSPESSISVEPLVRQDLAPAVGVEWGKNSAALSPANAREYALALLDAAASAEMDAAIMRWCVHSLGTTEEEACFLVGLIRERRQEGKVPSCTLNLGTESIRPATARSRGLYLIGNATNTEVEAVLVVSMLETGGLDMESVEDAIEELRRIRGLETDWDRLGLSLSTTTLEVNDLDTGEQQA